MRVARCHLDALVTHEFLRSFCGHVRHREPASEAMSQIMPAEVLNASFIQRGIERLPPRLPRLVIIKKYRVIRVRLALVLELLKGDCDPATTGCERDCLRPRCCRDYP